MCASAAPPVVERAGRGRLQRAASAAFRMLFHASGQLVIFYCVAAAQACTQAVVPAPCRRAMMSGATRHYGLFLTHILKL